MPHRYDRAVQMDLPGGVTAHGWSAADEFWMRLRSALPVARHSRSITASAVRIRYVRRVRRFAGACRDGTTVPALSVRRPARNYMCSASVTPNSARAGCGANGCCMTRPRSSSKSSCTQADEERSSVAEHMTCIRMRDRLDCGRIARPAGQKGPRHAARRPRSLRVCPIRRPARLHHELDRSDLDRARRLGTFTTIMHPT